MMRPNKHPMWQLWSKWGPTQLAEEAIKDKALCKGTYGIELPTKQQQCLINFGARPERKKRKDDLSTGLSTRANLVGPVFFYWGLHSFLFFVGAIHSILAHSLQFYGSATFRVFGLGQAWVQVSFRDHLGIFLPSTSSCIWPCVSWKELEPSDDSEAGGQSGSFSFNTDLWANDVDKMEGCKGSQCSDLSQPSEEKPLGLFTVAVTIKALTPNKAATWGWPTINASSSLTMTAARGRGRKPSWEQVGEKEKRRKAISLGFVVLLINSSLSNRHLADGKKIWPFIFVKETGTENCCRFSQRRKRGKNSHQNVWAKPPTQEELFKCYELEKHFLLFCSLPTPHHMG